MAEPTLKDVLAALAALDKKMTSETGAIRAEMATKDALESVAADLAKVDAKVESVAADVKAHRAETAKGFAAIDRELAGHSERTHRAIEVRLDKLEKPKRIAAPRAPRRR